MPTKAGFELEQTGGMSWFRLFFETADLMRSVPECVQYVIGQSSDDPDEIRILTVWTSKEAHDQSENDPALRKFIGEALPMLDGKPSSERWIVRGGKGIGQ